MNLLFPMWREWLIGFLLIAIVGCGFYIYHKGYVSCEIQTRAATADAKSAAEEVAIRKQAIYQSNANALLNAEKARNKSLGDKINALSKNPCDNNHLNRDAQQLYNSRIRKTYSAQPPL